MDLPFLPYAKQSLTEADREAVVESLQQELITRGPQVEEFEQAVAAYCQVPHAVAFNSGTAALMAAYFAANLTPFDRVISTPNSFIATVGAPLKLNAQLHFVDLSQETGNLDLEQLDVCLKVPASRGRPFIVPVHFAGIAQDMRALNQSLRDPETVVIEDAAHAFGSRYPSGEKVGSCAYSDLTIFSFHPAKTLTTGEGGMVTTNSSELYHRLQLFRNNGIEREAPHLHRPAAAGYYEVHQITGNFNVTSFQAALGLSQLKRIDDFVEKRRKLVARYRSRLKRIPHLTLFTHQFDKHTAFHLFVVQIDFEAYCTTRTALMQALKEKGIGTQVHYVPLYYHPVCRRDLEKEQNAHPQMERYYRQALSLPLYYDLSEEDVDRVCDTLLDCLQVRQRNRRFSSKK